MKAYVLRVDGTIVTAVVKKSRATTIKSGKFKVLIDQLRHDPALLKKEDQFLFVPDTQEGNVWRPRAGSFYKV